jgi:hypothetical protein
MQRFLMVVVAALLLISASPAQAQGGQVSQITFARGTTSALVVNQYVPANGVREFWLGALAGQVMTVQINNPSGALALSIYGQNDGRVLLDAVAGQTLWTGTLPSTQRYNILVVNRGAAVNIDLYVSIPARISFKRGTTSAVLDGTLPAQQRAEYVLRASAGQTLSVAVTAVNQGVWVSVYGADGTPLSGVNTAQAEWIGTLPTTQDYVIALSNSGTTATTFTLYTYIPSRVRFAPGAVSARLQGFVEEPASNEYILAARAGQLMTVTITSPNTQVGLAISGLDGLALKRYPSVPVNTWSGRLPSTQDYLISALSLGGSHNYTLDITITN